MKYLPSQLVVLACLLGLALASPKPQYNNNAPPAPANLYERPTQNSPRPQPPKRTPPPKRPQQNYGPPQAQATNPRPTSQNAPPPVGIRLSIS